MSFIRKTKFIIIIIIFFIWMHYIQTAELSPELLTVFKITKKMTGLIIVGSIFASIILGYLFFIKYFFPNLTDAEMKAIQRKLKKKQNTSRSIKADNEIKRETKTLVEKIKKLKHLYKNGSLTNIEFEQAKNKLLK
jgi:Na+/melibiose symporter-like transporter